MSERLELVRLNPSEIKALNNAQNGAYKISGTNIPSFRPFWEQLKKDDHAKRHLKLLAKNFFGNQGKVSEFAAKHVPEFAQHHQAFSHGGMAKGGPAGDTKVAAVPKAMADFMDACQGHTNKSPDGLRTYFEFGNFMSSIPAVQNLGKAGTIGLGAAAGAGIGHTAGSAIGGAFGEKGKGIGKLIGTLTGAAAGAYGGHKLGQHFFEDKTINSPKVMQPIMKSALSEKEAGNSSKYDQLIHKAENESLLHGLARKHLPDAIKPSQFNRASDQLLNQKEAEEKRMAEQRMAEQKKIEEEKKQKDALLRAQEAIRKKKEAESLKSEIDRRAAATALRKEEESRLAEEARARAHQANMIPKSQNTGTLSKLQNLGASLWNAVPGLSSTGYKKNQRLKGMM